METAIIASFCALLLLCVLLGRSILYALAAGLILFLLYGRRKGLSWSELGRLALSGVKTVRNILISFLLIGMLTALWRDAGTIAVVVCYAGGLIRPAVFLVMAFLLNCLVSFLTGTSFGTAATVGVICTTIAATMQLDPLLVGGAVLSGVFFGDRCSPVSTSALLVASVTGTDLYRNIRGMLRTALVPFCVTCAVYAVAGGRTAPSGTMPDLHETFAPCFALRPVALLPAAVILLLALLHVDVKLAMGASILSALPVCVLVQHTAIADLPSLLVFGYHAADPQLAGMLDGGGILSMARVAAIVCLSSSYSGILQRTGLLDRTKRSIDALAQRTTPYAAMLCTSIGASVVSCNQTMAILLTHQLCARPDRDRAETALQLEDTAVLVAPLVPWSIAGAVPLASIGAPTAALFFACYLYLIPLWRLPTAQWAKRHATT